MWVCAAFGSAHPLAWVVLILGTTGTYLAITDNVYLRDSSQAPRQPLARWSLRVAENGRGAMAVNVPGVLEAVAYIPLALLGPWALTSAAAPIRIACLAAAVAWVGSCLTAVFTDAAFYSPYTDTPLIDAARPFAPLVAALVGMAFSTPAPWSANERWVAAAVCATLLFVQVRINELDRVLIDASAVSQGEQTIGRSDMAEAIHQLLGPPMANLRTIFDETDNPLPDHMWDHLSALEGGYSQAIEYEHHPDRDIDWPGLLRGALDRLEAAYQVRIPLDVPPDPLAPVDRAIGHDLLRELAVNAVRSGATLCELTLSRSDDRYVVTAQDNGRPIAPHAWKRRGGGLQRLERRLERTGAGNGIELLDTSLKRIQAKWTATRNYKEI